MTQQTSSREIQEQDGTEYKRTIVKSTTRKIRAQLRQIDDLKIPLNSQQGN